MIEFDSFADNYIEILDESVGISGDSSTYFTEYKARYVNKTVTGASAAKILDFGCGVGLLSMALKRFLPSAVLHGYDVSVESIGQVDPELVEQGLYTSNISEIDRDYDAIILSNVLHHIDKAERLPTILSLKLRLAATGKLIVFEHNPMNPLTRKVVDRCPFDEGVLLLSPRETVSYMSQAGVMLARYDYIVFFPRVLAALRSLEPLLSWCPLGAQYAVVGEKHG